MDEQVKAAFGAIEYGAKSVAPIFLEAVLKGNPDAINWRNDRGRTLLMEASLNGRTPLVEVLIRNGADLEARETDGTTALMLAAIRGHDANVNALLDAGAKIDAADDECHTAEDYAGFTGRKKTIKLLQTRAAAPAKPVTGAAPPPPKP